MTLYEEFDDACSILVPVDIVNTPGALVSMTTGEGAFSRASVGTYFDSNGVLQTAAANVKRSTYDPANLMAPPNDLIEPAATNSIRNNTMQGAVVGSPGTFPAFWGSAATGLTRQVVGTGMEAGIEYIDLRYSGSSTGEIIIEFDSPTATAVSPGESWQGSVFVTRIAGSFENVTNCRTRMREGLAAGTFTTDELKPFVPGIGSLAVSRVSQSRVVGPNSERLTFQIRLNLGGAVDFTLRIGLPQLERDRVTSVIKTTNAAATRAADVVGPAPEVPEDTSPAWSSAVTYAAGDRVYLLSTHRVYESTGMSGNAGKDPSVPVNQVTGAGVPTYWLDLQQPTNRTAAFDYEVQSQTLAASPLVITLQPGALNGFALFGVDADTYSVEVLDTPNGNVIYSEPTTALEGSMPGDYYEYFYERFKPLRQLIRSGIDPYATAQIKLTLKRATGLIGLGMFAVGDFKNSGVSLKGTSVEPTDFSSIVQDRFGRASIRRRANSTGMSVTTVLEEDEVGTVLENIKEALGRPCVVSATSVSMYEWMTVFGTVSAKVSDPADLHPYKQLALTVRGFI